MGRDAAFKAASFFMFVEGIALSARGLVLSAEQLTLSAG